MQAKWSDINISLVDDRVVDKNHDDSNEKLVIARKLLFTANSEQVYFTEEDLIISVEDIITKLE